MRIGLRSVAFSGAMILLCILAVGAFTGVTSSVAQAQQENTRPMTLDGLMAALRAGRGILPPSEYIQKIQKRGVSFEVTAGVERQLRQAGATTEIVQAARANYRGERPQPHPSPAPAHEQQPASLLVICDLACNWKLDGKEQGRIEAGDSAKTKVVLGQHIVQAVTVDGADRVKQFSEVKASGQTVVSIELQPVRDARLKTEQAAREQAARAQAAANLPAQAKKWNSDGDTLYEQKRYAEALPYYQKACDSGNVDGCANLGFLYGNGQGVTKDDFKASTLLQKACDGGHAEGCFNLGIDYAHGDGVTQDDFKAAMLYQKACNGGYTRGCTNLGVLYDNGRGMTQDYFKAATLFQKACDGGEAMGCSNLGVLYVSGQGVTQDYFKAATVFQKACDGGYANGCSNMGDLYRLGNGVRKDAAKARELLQKGCSMGNQWGCDRLKEMR
jgi:TPR repeat protein